MPEMSHGELLLLQARKQVRDEGILTLDLMMELQMCGFNPDNVITLVLTDEVERPLEEAYHRAFTNPDLDSKRILSLVTEVQKDDEGDTSDFGPSINPNGLGYHEVTLTHVTM